MQISLPDLSPGDQHEVSFWAVAYSFWLTGTNPEIVLIDGVEVSTSSIDTNPANNVADVTTPLNP